MNSLLITGANGLLGQHLLARASDSDRLVATDLAARPFFDPRMARYIPADLTDAGAVGRLLEAHRPQAVIHTAALTHVDRCETERDLAWRLNVEAARYLAEGCQALGARMVHLSTDYVFDGQDGPYDESRAPNPLSYYGLTKLESEKVVTALLPDAVIARTMVLFGHAPGVRPNFVTWLVGALKGGQRVRIVNDQWGNPTWAGDLASMLLALLDSGASGVFHTAGPQWLHRHAFALKIAKVFGLDSTLIEAVPSSSLGQAATRPLRSGLRIDKLLSQTGLEPLSLEAALERMKNEMNAHAQ